MSNNALQIDNSIERQPRVDAVKALRLRMNKGMSFQEIGTQLGVSAQAVQQRLKKLKPLISDPEINQAYESNKAQLLSEVESQLLVQLVDSDKLKDASLNNIAYSFAQVSNFNRLAQDKSTQNLDIKSLQLHSQSELEASVKAREALMQRLDEAEVGDTP